MDKPKLTVLPRPTINYEHIEAAETNLDNALVKAVNTVIELMDDPLMHPRLRFDCAKYITDLRLGKKDTDANQKVLNDISKKLGLDQVQISGHGENG